MKYYGKYNNEGIYTAFYNNEIHGNNIPPNCIELNYDQWQEAITGNYKVINNKHVKYTKLQSELDEIEISSVRISRNYLLSSSDWTQLSDVPFSKEKKLEWKIYRQKLRDITKSKPYIFPKEP